MFADQRKDKLRKIEEAGINPYPARVTPGREIKQVLDEFESRKESSVEIAGRIMSVRKHGKSCFMDINDGTAKIQLYFKYNILGKENYEHLDWLDIGDIIGVSGEPFVTRKGERSLNVSSYQLLSKSLLPLPEKWHGLKDPDLRYRKRYLDLIANPESKRKLRQRSQIMQLIRAFLDNQGFQEFETPILQNLYGGAFAKPFTTYMDALDKQLYLRIATELYLKRLLIGGFPKVYELGKDFRNEGLDRMHNPEFTALEIYQAYSDYYQMMKLTEELLIHLVKEIKGEPRLKYQENEIELKAPFERVQFAQKFKEATGIDLRTTGSGTSTGSGTPASEDELYSFCQQHSIKITRKSLPKMVEKIFDEMVVSELINPTFVMDYPVYMSPLAKKKDDLLVERFEFYMFGMEVANAFTELNDPREQKARFEYQMKLKAEGEEEVQEMDTDFLEALAYGMPPAGGIGFGVDRLIMILTDAYSIREIIPFPTLK